MGYQIGDRKLPLDVAWTDADGIQRPANWLRLSTERDRELLGITWVADTSNNYDQRFYWAPTNPKQLNDEPAVDAEGNELGYTQTGLKTLWKAKQNDIAASLLAPSDWRVVKVLEVNTSFSAAKTALPTKWQTYRAAVRTACNTRQTEIDNCSDVPALKELLFGSAQIQQTDDDGNGVVDDDGNAVMIANPNIATAWPDPVS
nr:Na-Ca exchanger/integrin-beta4 [uncultured Mediterranean phage uvMED]